MSRPLFLAVDAGNSKTVALVVNADGEILGRGRSGCGDIYGTAHVDDAIVAVTSAITQALHEAETTATQVSHTALRLAGVDYPEDAAWWDQRLHEAYPTLGSRSIKNDAFASLRLIDGSGVGVSITVGTGPAVAARAPSGAEEFSGMFVFDDLGGGGLGNAALEAACRDWMQLGPDTALTARLCDAFDVTDPWHLRHAFTQRFGARPPSDLRHAAKLVLECADDGDAVALAIVAAQATAFVGYAQWCTRRIGVSLASGDLPVIVNGSVATSHHTAMRNALIAQLHHDAPRAVVHIAQASPLSGVALDALAEGGVTITAEVMDRLQAEHPDHFLAT